jgi:D-xylose transport system substrate-binding protein
MKISTRRAVVISTALLLTAGTLTACSNGSETNATSSASASSASIGLLLPDSVTARYESADKPYFEAKVKSLCPDCKVLYANADGDAAKQQQQAESMLTQGVKVLVLDPFDGVAAAAIVNEAKAQNVPVISYDRLIDSPDLAFYISFDNEKVGELQGTALVDKLKKDGVAPGDGGILMVNGSPTDNNATLFKAGAHKVIDPSGYKILAEYDTPGWDPAQAQTWVAGQITQFGSQIKGVYAANDGTAGGAIAAMKGAGVTPIPPTTGQDAELAGIQRILLGDQYMTVYKALKPEAEKAASLAVDLINGKTVKGDTTVKTASGAEIQSFLLTPVAVTVDNIQDTVVKDGFYTAAEICTPDYAAACTAAGIK